MKKLKWKIISWRHNQRWLCYFGIHSWDHDCDGWSGDEWDCCHNCLKPMYGTLQVWDGKQRKMVLASPKEQKELITQWRNREK